MAKPQSLNHNPYHNPYKEKLYRGVIQGYQRAISPLSKFYFGHFSGQFRAYLSRIELARRRRGLTLVLWSCPGNQNPAQKKENKEREEDIYTNELFFLGGNY